MRLHPDDLFKMYEGEPQADEITSEHRANAETLAPRVNALLDEFEADGNEPLNASPVTGTILSTKNAGWRPQIAPGAKNSAHKLGGAGDLHDPAARLDKWIMERPKIADPATGKRWPDVLVRHDLFMEHPDATAGQVTKGGWCHLSCIGPKSGNRVFYP